MTTQDSNHTLQAQRATEVAALRSTNDLSQRYGLTLTDAQISMLLVAREDALRSTGRVEFGEGILPLLVRAFCDSPYIMRDDYATTLLFLQDLFYMLKNELYDALSDDELIESMEHIFHGKAQGSLEYLENVTPEELFRALSGEPEDTDDD